MSDPSNHETVRPSVVPTALWIAVAFGLYLLVTIFVLPRFGVMT